MKKVLLVVAMLLAVSQVMASVSITAFNEGTKVAADTNTLNRAASILITYSGDVNVRAFALDINVDNGCNFTNIRDFNVGENNSTVQGYGIFPGRFRQFVNPIAPNWGDINYSPLTPWGDPGTTNTGIGYPVAIVEMGYLGAGDSNKPAKSGTLFRIDVNGYLFQGTAHLTISPDTMRGGVVDKDTNATTTATNLPATFDIVFPSSCTSIPDLTGMTKAQADAAITAANAGFTPNGTPVVGCTGTYNIVLPGFDTGCFSPPHTVNYTYEAGKNIANEVGAVKATAEGVWTAAGFTLGTATPVVQCPAGNIVSQSFTGCHALPYTINYTYGIAATEPNIVNKTMSDANATIIAAGLTVGTITYEPNGLKAALTVDRQSPAAGTVTCSAVNYVVDTNCLYTGRVFSLYGTVTFTVTAAQVGYWNALGRPACWCCVSQKRGNGVYTGSTATKTDALDLAAVKNAANWTKSDSAAANVCLDFNLSNKIDALDLAVVKNANNWTKATGSGPPCQ